MSRQPSTKTRASTRRPKSRKVTAAAKKTVDLTTEEKQTDKNNSSSNKMENPGHLESDDYFVVLNVSRSVSNSEVKRAYRKLAVQWHPDKNRSNPRAEEFFKKISEAYAVLCDPEKRKAYERYGKTGPERGAASSRGADDQFDFSARGGGFSTQHARDIFDAFFGDSDPFETFFGGGAQRRRSAQRRGMFGEDPFESMGFGGMGMGMNMRGFGDMGGMSMTDSFFSGGFGGMDGSGSAVYSTSTSSSSSTFTDRNGHVITQKTTTTTGADGRTETVTEEFRDGRLMNSSSTGSRLADAGRMQLGASGRRSSQSYQRRGSRTKY